MDAMSLLRSYRDDTPQPDEQRLRPSRDRLEQRFEVAPRRRAASRRLVLIGGVAAVAATVLVVASVTAGPAPQASAEASRLLETAAGAARAASGPDGVRVVTVRSEGLSERLGDDGDVSAAYSTRQVVRLRVPQGGGRWVRTSWSLPPDAFYGGAAARALAEQEGAGDPAHTAADPLVERSRDGDFTNGQLGGGTVFGEDRTALRDLPGDPAALLAALRRADLGAADDGQAAHVLEAASIVLSSGVPDGDQQAVVFQALRLQRGLAVVDESVEVDGRSGVAVGEAAPSWRSDAHQLLLDPRTGEYLGDRSVALQRQGVIPAGAVLSSTTVLRP